MDPVTKQQADDMTARVGNTNVPQNKRDRDEVDRLASQAGGQGNRAREATRKRDR